MRKTLIVGILRETKPMERRAPLIPEDVAWLVKRGIKVEVESSDTRIFKDQDYRISRAKVLDRFQNANLILGIKEPRIENLYQDKIYMVFSHTAKGQLNNIPLLKASLENRITLVDYEKITDSHGKRLVYFGRFAGICGLIDSLHYFGKKLQYKGIRNPFLKLKPAYKYDSLQAVKLALEEVDKQIQHQGFEKAISPFIIGVTGHGNVSAGVQEILSCLDSVEVHPRDMLEFIRRQKGMRNKIYKIIFLREEKIRSKTGKGFWFEEYLKNPERFESNLDIYLPFINILIHTSYWDKRFPRMVTREMIHQLRLRRPFRLEFIGDISCDINGSIELTYKSTNSLNPTFTYDHKAEKFIDGYQSEGLTILAVDNLPTELPRDASGEFSSLVRDYVYQIAAQGVKDLSRHAALPEEIRRAVITQGGKLTRSFRYLEKFLKPADK